MSISNIIDQTTKKIFPSLILGGGGAGVESLTVKEGLDNVGTASDPIVGLAMENLGDLLVGNGTANEAEVLPVGPVGKVLKATTEPAGTVPAWGDENNFTVAGQTIYAGAGPDFETQYLPIGTAGQVLKVNAGATAPEWANESVATAFTAEGQLLYGGAGPAFNPAQLNIGTSGQFISSNGTVPVWANGSSGGLQDGFGLYLSTPSSLTNQNSNAPDNGPQITFTGSPAPLTSGICGSLVIYDGGAGFPKGLRWTGTNPVAIFLQADLLCQSKITAGGAPANFITVLTDYNFACAGIQISIRDTSGGYITPICRFLNHPPLGVGSYERGVMYSGIMNPTDVVEFEPITNWCFNKTGSDPAGTYTFDITLGAVNVYVCECAYPV